LTDLTKKYDTLKEEVLRLRTENSDLNVLLEKEKTKTENLNDQIQRFETTTTTLNSKLEELQKTVKPSISDAARQELDNLEIKSAKLQNIAKLKDQNAITEAEANEMKAKLLKDLS
jgi:DNA repair ATPase RecN